MVILVLKEVSKPPEAAAAGLAANPTVKPAINNSVTQTLVKFFNLRPVMTKYSFL